MGDITYEQFESWCKHWNFTVEEGFRAMCFVANIVGQNFGNHADALAKVENNTRSSEAFRCLTKSFRDDALVLSTLYGKLENNIYCMLEKHDGREAY